MIRISHELVVRRPVEVVFPYASNLENMPQWGTSLAVEKLTEGPIGVGTRYREQAAFRGRRMELPDEVVAYEPNRTFAVHTASRMLDSTTTTTFEPIGEGTTRLTYRVEARPFGLVRLAAPLIARGIKRQFVADLANLKRILEAEADPAP